MTDRLDKLDYYTLLGVPEDADTGAIRIAFRKFARRYHPDRFVGKPAEKIERASRIYCRGGEAFQVLSRADTRAEYDKRLASGEIRLSAEDQDRAIMRATHGEPKKKKVHPIRTTEALTIFKQAVVETKRKDFMAAWRLMKRAMEVEPNNEFLEDRFARIDAYIRSNR